MSPEKQRISIATACGWTDIRRQRLYVGDQDLWGTKLIDGENYAPTNQQKAAKALKPKGYGI